MHAARTRFVPRDSAYVRPGIPTATAMGRAKRKANVSVILAIRGRVIPVRLKPRMSATATVAFNTVWWMKIWALIGSTSVPAR